MKDIFDPSCDGTLALLKKETWSDGKRHDRKSYEILFNALSTKDGKITHSRMLLLDFDLDGLIDWLQSLRAEN